MKRILLILLVSCSCSMAWAQKEYETPYSTKSLAGQNVSEVEATTSGEKRFGGKRCCRPGKN